MIDQQDVELAAERFRLPDGSFERLELRRDKKRRDRRIRAGAVGLLVALAVGWWGLDAIRSTPIPAEPPVEPIVDLGIFEPVAGSIVYFDHRDDSLWAVDPNAQSPASTPVRLDLRGTAAADAFTSWTEPLGWSSDGTELLFLRQDPSGSFGDGQPPFDSYLFILHADGTETEVTPMTVEDAAISPDGSRVVFAAEGVGLYIVDSEGGQPVRIAEEGSSPTFSPDGTRIAYISSSRAVWVMNADGTDAHEILADESLLTEGFFDLSWSPAGDRIAMQMASENHTGISTFAPDGSDLTEVIADGFIAHWSPDGSQIAYRVPGRANLSIADADGSNVRTLDVGEPGPWHPGAIAASDGGDVAPVLAADEILWLDSTAGDDLLAVDAASGDARVLVEDIRAFRGARRSADGRWVAYERWSGTSPALYVVGPELEPRKVIDLPDEGVLETWAWSSTGALLAVDRVAHLDVIDPATGSVTELPSTFDVDAPPAWSPDGTRILLGATGGTIHSVDVRSGERSVLAQLPDGDLGSTTAISWSPDGSRLAVYSEVGSEEFPPPGRLFVMDADGSDIRVLAEGVFFPGFDWSPDGSRITFAEMYGDGSRIWVAPTDGSTPSIVDSSAFENANPDSTWGLPAWSPDGSQVAFSGEPNRTFVIDAGGSGEPERIDDLTYASWNGGSFCWSCLWWINHPVTYSAPGPTS